MGSRDSQLADAGRGDWRSWYQRHAARLLLYVRQWLPGRADAEDAVQAGFVKFWRHKPCPQDGDTPLLYSAVRCAAHDFIRSRSRRQKRMDALADLGDDAWWDADTLVERERAEQMQAVLRRLDPGQREVIVLHVWAEMTFAEIAVTLGANCNTVAGRYRSALANLRKLITEEHHERP